MRGICGGILLLCGVAGWVGAAAQAVAQPATVAAVMLSDLHFDPFHDPAKTKLLVAAPIGEWDGILGSAESPGAEADFAAVQSACKAKEASDPPYALLESALKAARKQAPEVRFVTVSGDLLVHEFDCRYRAALKMEKAHGDDQSASAAFAAKTTVYVMKEVERMFAGIPVYIALGNNDSRCNHNRLDVGDAYLRATGQAAMDGLVGVSAEERSRARETYDSAGYYAVTMAAPMERTRLLVIDDVYMMSKFANCEGDESDHKGADEQIAWLNKELDGARERGERVWVMGHVPPAVAPRSALTMKGAMCAIGGVETQLASDALADALTAHADVVQLAIFGHTHVGGVHVLGSKGAQVPVLVVSSVTAVTGNTPTFTVGRVAPAAATLMDYAVYAASNRTGVGTKWAWEYDFGKAYHEPSFTPESLDELIGRFHADSAGVSAESVAYQQNTLAGLPVTTVGPLWPGYACSLDHWTAAGFKWCVCGGK